LNLPPLISNPWQLVKLPAPLPVAETDSGAVTKAHRTARGKLKKKNRKGKKHRIVVPLNLTLEAGNVYTLEGFSPDFDGNWLLIECEHKFVGKSGSTTSLDFEKVITGY
jgi:hypothetical protein